jgi:hypothetical protein
LKGTSITLTQGMADLLDSLRDQEGEQGFQAVNAKSANSTTSKLKFMCH